MPFEIHCVCFTRTGVLHENAGAENEDIPFTSEQGNLFFYGIADGQSRKKYCKEGAHRSLETVCQYICERGITGLRENSFSDKTQFELIRSIRTEIQSLAETYKAEFEDFSSTLLVLAIEPWSEDFAVLHLGDGCILGDSREHGVKILSAPEYGSSPRYTWLTTSEDAQVHLRISFGSIRDWKRIILVTDGTHCIARGSNIQRCACKYITHPDPSVLGQYVMMSEGDDDRSCMVIDILADEQHSQ